MSHSLSADFSRAQSARCGYGSLAFPRFFVAKFLAGPVTLGGYLLKVPYLISLPIALRRTWDALTSHLATSSSPRTNYIALRSRPPDLFTALRLDCSSWSITVQSRPIASLSTQSHYSSIHHSQYNLSSWTT
ncbi:hypothetical protein LY78DRAFT_651935 [Colletotrichum sublineola]|nr:hypothetical protein LY78DRAFT_651935 [Colletotrichum sublineola]